MGYTRKQYMNKEVSFNDYYNQFAIHCIDIIVASIGREKILNSNDKHFNDIQLSKWDSLQPIVLSLVGKLINKANNNNGVSLSDCVCTAKQAARLYKEREQLK